MSQGEKRVLFDAAKDGQNIAPKWVAPEDEQEPNESRRCALPISVSLSLVNLTVVGRGRGGRLWTRLTRAIVAKEMDAATEAKTAVEDAQRETRRNLEERGDTHVPRFFHLKDGRWVPKLACVPPPSFPSSPTPSLGALMVVIELTGHGTTSHRLPTDSQDAVAAVEKFIWPTLPPSYT